MRRVWMGIFIYFIFLVESTIVHWFLPEVLMMRIYPNFILVIVLYFAVFKNRHAALGLGLAIGLLKDVVQYGFLIGPYGFSMGLLGYVAGLLFNRKPARLITMLYLVLFGYLFVETIVFFIYSFFKVTHMTYLGSLTNHMIPTLILQILFTLAIHIPMVKYIEKTRFSNRDQEIV